jgi:hypothetical protein
MNRSNQRHIAIFAAVAFAPAPFSMVWQVAERASLFPQLLEMWR